MPTHETGHYKNVAALEEMILKVTAMGTAYNPSKAAIKIANLQTLFTNAKTDYLAVSPASTTFNNAVNDRLTVYQPLKSYATKILAAFKSSSDASAQKVKDLVTINRKIQGSRASKIDAVPIDPSAPAPNNISVSQQSYDMKFDNFSKLVDILTSEATYLPNETELKLPAIQTFKTSLLTANTNVATAYENVNLARIKRDKTLYKAITGVYDIQNLVKEYVKGAFGASNIQYKQIAAIKFNKPRKLYI